MLSVGFVVRPNFHVMSLAPISVFEVAALVVGEPAYDVRLCPNAAELCGLRPASASRLRSLVVRASTRSWSRPDLIARLRRPVFLSFSSDRPNALVA